MHAPALQVSGGCWRRLGGWLLGGLCAALLSGCGLLAKPGATEASAPANFVLEISAEPAAVRDVLEQHLELKRYQHLPGLRRQELTRLVGVADANIRSLLGTLGYFSPTIELQLIHPPRDSDALRTVRIVVDPGEQTTVAGLDIQVHSPQGDAQDGRWQRQAVARNWPLQVGQPFTQSAWHGAKAEGLRSLQARRYPTAQLAHSSADVDADTQQAQLRLVYDTGPLYRFGPLQFQYADGDAPRYDAAGLLRVARLPEGAEYRQSTLLDVQQRLAATGLFDSVFLTLMTDQAPPGQAQVQVPVLAQVREAPLQKWVYGLGMSTDTGLRVSLDHTHHRVPGLGWQAQNKLQLDRQNPLASTRLYSLPDHTGWNWFTSAQAERAELADYQANSVALSAGRSKNEDQVDRYYALRYDLANPQGANAPQSSSALSANYGWTGRYFNNPTNPTRGYGLATEIGLGSTLTPQRSPFVRASLRWQYFQPLERDDATRRRGRLAWRANLGALVARSDAPMPLTLLFLSGGDTTVRGYSYQSIGTRTDVDTVIGGRYLASGSLEWQRPMVLAGNRQDWEHTVFIDAGTVADDFAATQLYVGAGTGIRWKSPVGPLQADLAYGFKTQQLRLHVRLGFNF